MKRPTLIEDMELIKKVVGNTTKLEDKRNNLYMELEIVLGLLNSEYSMEHRKRHESINVEYGNLILEKSVRNNKVKKTKLLLTKLKKIKYK